MKKNVRYASEGDIDSAALGAKLNFGGHLYMRVAQSEERVFNFRVCLNGKDTTLTIGKYPEMSLAEARQVARLRQSEVERTRKEHAAGAFQERLSSLKQKKTSKSIENLGGFRSTYDRNRIVGFGSLQDAGKFVKGLNKAKDDLSQELCIWLTLKLLIPSGKDYLLRAKWSDLDAARDVWYVRRGTLRQGTAVAQGKLVAPLSVAAKRALYDLWRITGKGEDVFPTLKNSTATVLRNSTRDFLERVWPHYHIDPNEFSNFFERIAMEYSLFHPAIVEGMLTHRPGIDSDYNQGTYIFQRRLLAEWWGETLDWFAFGHSGQFWGMSDAPAPPAQTRPHFGNI